MADDNKKIERIYTVNLGAAYEYLRTKRAIRAVKILREYLARHFKADIKEVKLSELLNAYIWRDSMQKPPRRVKVRGIKDGQRVNVYLHDEEEIKKVKAENKKQKDAKKAAKKKEKKPAQKKTEEKKKEPVEAKK